MSNYRREIPHCYNFFFLQKLVICDTWFSCLPSFAPIMILLCLLVANSKIRDNAEYVHNVERESCFKTSTGDRKQGESFDIFQVPHGNEL